MTKTKTRCLSLAIVIVGVLVIGSGVASGVTGLGVSTSCLPSPLATQGGAFSCTFTIENQGSTPYTIATLTVDPDGPGGVAPVTTPCFRPGEVIAATVLDTFGNALDSCTGVVASGTIPFTCSTTDASVFVGTVAVTGADQEASATGSASNGPFVAGLVCNDGSLCTTDSCIPTSDPATAEGCQTAPVNCDDENECTIDSCVQATGCLNAPDPACADIDGRMTGGGSIFTPSLQRVTHGFELHCDVEVGPNNLQINWGDGNRFHLEELTTATCTDDAAIDQRPPGHSTFDTFIGTGVGRCNGVSGALITFTFVDAGEPGKNDTADIVITGNTGCPDGLSVSGSLKKGNHQAHRNN